MMSKALRPDDPLAFIRDCVRNRRLLWTYHVNMRLRDRSISRQAILEGVDTYEIIESYPEDKYFPSYLVLARYGHQVIHALFAADVADSNVRVITAYQPSPDEWSDDFRRRRKP